ncbi:twin-arginine translocation signal domain-containing protein [Actinoplanes sp. NPDC049599]|uniref:twin-arginine translocation signal domain-containing protein n=1 Tax=Actinoplanes sp. NPDC049599 TaxID=3363903 RepID=UPI00379FC9FF
MSPRLLVAGNLLRIYRPVALWFWSLMIVGIAVAMTVLASVTDPPVSLWLVVAGAAAKYWVGVVGVLVVSMNLRQFVANGITRRDFLAGAALAGVLAAVLFSVAVPLGHEAEQLLLGGFGPVTGRYPATSLGTGLRELGHILPASLAFLVTGAAGTAGFYRYGAWGGLALLPLAVLPVAAAEALLGVDEHGGFDARLVPYAAAVLVTLTVTALVGLLVHLELRDVAIRRGAPA